MDAISGDVLVTLEQLLYNENHAERLLQTHTVGKPPLFYLDARSKRATNLSGSFWLFAIELSHPALDYPHGNSAGCRERCRPQVLREDSANGAPDRRHCRSANLPEDLVQFISADPETAGDLIDAGPDMIFFTGSSQNGRKVAMRAAERLIPTLLELGGKDPSLVFADCNFQRAVEGVAYGAFANAGQVCVGIKRLYVEESIFLHSSMPLPSASATFASAALSIAISVLARRRTQQVQRSG